LSFIKRLTYYLGGVGLGSLLLMFFLSGKKTSCDYGPNARTLKFLKNKPLKIIQNTVDNLDKYGLDTTNINQVFENGDVNFSKSQISQTLPNIYILEFNVDSIGQHDFTFEVRKDSIILISIKPSSL
jgi:hypothetical protein